MEFSCGRNSNYIFAKFNWSKGNGNIKPKPDRSCFDSEHSFREAVYSARGPWTSSDKRLIIKYKNNFLDQGDKELKLLSHLLVSKDLVTWKIMRFKLWFVHLSFFGPWQTILCTSRFLHQQSNFAHLKLQIVSVRLRSLLFARSKCEK